MIWLSFQVRLLFNISLRLTYLLIKLLACSYSFYWIVYLPSSSLPSCSQWMYSFYLKISVSWRKGQDQVGGMTLQSWLPYLRGLDLPLHTYFNAHRVGSFLGVWYIEVLPRHTILMTCAILCGVWIELFSYVLDCWVSYVSEESIKEIDVSNIMSYETHIT